MAGGYKIVLTVKNERPQVSEETWTKPAAIKEAKRLLEPFQFPTFANADVVSVVDGSLAERFSAGWPDGKVRHVNVHGNQHYDLAMLKSAKRWKVALGKKGMSEKFLTEGSWPTKEAARKVAITLLEGGTGPWTSAVVVEVSERPSAAKVAARYVARLAKKRETL